jgi:hypothetical protein
MAEPTIKTEFVGGQCDQIVKQVPVSQLATGTITCGISTYVVQGVTPTLYRATWIKLAEQAGPGPGMPPGTQFNLAWGRLMHTLAFTVPRELKAQRLASLRIRKAVR